MQLSTANHLAKGRDFLDELETAKKFLTVKELAELLAINEKTIYGYVARGLVPYYKIQSSVRFRPKQIAEWLGRRSSSVPPNQGPSAFGFER